MATNKERKWLVELMNKELNNFERGRRLGAKQELNRISKLYYLGYNNKQDFSNLERYIKERLAELG